MTVAVHDVAEVASADGAAPAVTTDERAEAVVVASMATVSVLNYAYTLILVWLLPAADYAVVGSASALLLICGTVSTASLPWVLAREVALGRGDPGRRQAAVAFCGVLTLVESVLVGVVVGAIAADYGNSAVVGAVFASVVAIFTAASAVGYLQGIERFRLIAGLRVGEVVVKFASGLALVALGAGAGGAIAGFALGAVVVAVVAVGVMAPDIRRPPTWRVDRVLLRHAGGLAAIQGGVAVLASVDIVVGALALHPRSSLATYQVAQILTRVPVFVGSALSMVAFPRLAARDGRPTQVIRSVLGVYVKLSIPIAIATATIPATLVHRMFPGGYGDVSRLLVWGAIGGLCMGTINLVTTFFQAEGDYTRPSVLLFAGVALQIGLVVLGIHLNGILGMAQLVALGAAVMAGVLLLLMRRRWRHCAHGVGRDGAMFTLLCVPLILLHDHLGAWFAWLIVGVGVPSLVSLARFRSASGQRRPRVLHLGYEDPRRPGAGGGSVRTHAVNSRLAGEFDITVVCARFKGAQGRTEDGVRYVHVGAPLGYMTSLLAYFACIPYALLRYGSDLVVEDFSAPFSTVGVPLMTSRPVVGVVQWLFARDKSRQYRVPFHVVESLGLRTHRTMIAVSDDLAATLRQRNPSAQVSVVHNGLDDAVFATPRPDERRHLVFLGRLEIAQKGLDLLLDAFASVRHEIDGDLLIGGDGPDLEQLEAQCRRLGMSDRVRFCGRIPADERLAFLASARLVVMPSRFESFGMVAAEALAVGTPVLAFDIACLRSLVTPDCGVLVDGLDAGAYGRAMRALMADDATRERLGQAGPASVAALRWDLLADRQGSIYRRVLDPEVDGPATPPAGPTGRRPIERILAVMDDAGDAGDGDNTGHTDNTDGTGHTDNTDTTDTTDNTDTTENTSNTDTGAGAGPADPPQVGSPRPNPGRLFADVIDALGTGRRLPRVVLVGNYGRGNVGDEALLAQLLVALEDKAKVTVLTRHPGRVTAQHDVPAAPMLSLRVLLVLWRADAVALGGGGMFGKGAPPLVQILPGVFLALKTLLGKRIYLVSVGVYRGTPRGTLAVLRFAARCFDGVWLRDQRSIDLLRQGWLGDRINAVLVGDPAVPLTPRPDAQARQFLADHAAVGPHPPLVLSLKATPDAAANARVIAQMTPVAWWWLRQRQGPLVVLPLSERGDYGLGKARGDAELGQQLCQALRRPDRMIVLPEGIEPRLAKAIIGHAAAVIAMRYHATVFAASMGRPHLGVVFEEKTRAWFEEIGGTSVEVTDFDVDATVAWLSRVVPAPPSLPVPLGESPPVPAEAP